MTAIERIEIHAPLIIATCAILIFFNISIVALRIFARKKTGEPIAADDCTCIAAAVFVLGSTVTFLIEATNKGLGYAETVGHPDDSGADANISYWPTEVLSIPAIGLIKLTFLLLYRRIFTKGGAKNLYWANLIYTVITAAWTICFTLLFVFFCGVHPQSYWINAQTEATQCVKTQPAHLSFVISDFIMDLITMVLPWPRLIQLQMPLRKKLGLLGVFLMGALTVVMSGLRMVMFIRLLSVQFDPDLDFEYISTSASFWTQLEMGIGLIAACLPVMYGMIRKGGIFKKRQGYRHGYSFGSQTFSGGRTVRTRSHTAFDLPYDGRKGLRLPSEEGADDFRTHPIGALQFPTTIANAQGKLNPSVDLELHSMVNAAT